MAVSFVRDSQEIRKSEIQLMLQIAGFKVFTVSGLLRKKQNREWEEEGRRSKKFLPPSRLALKCLEVRNSVEVGNANFQHK